ncbi:hypothetical protein [Pedobacter metabolipauper]|uniref:MG2 domain-containing protein n=1 Tax=Pedobacter metabolipauper TaxID=425513 RepID=A0A4R6SWP3_9SPHI|nr:hypothetical protein [Pedobacter metabolipauper]TDQ08821.1 hypothetical protein ATK78_3340 [Pedobacter metabolipauper]
MLKLSKLFTRCFILFLGVTLSAKAQSSSSAPTLFVHYDKTIYTNNETIWFTGYLLKGNPEENSKHGVLSVALVRDIDSAVIKQDKYLMVNGISLGCMVLPDSLVAGNYHLQASTNRVRKGIPDALFLQPIIIKTNIDPAFNASIKLLNAGKKDNSPNQLSLTVTTKDARFLPKPVDVTYKYGNIYKKTKTNVSGELVFTIDEQPDLADPNVYAKVTYGKDSSFINIPIPVSKRRASVSFYPEGGNLIEGVPCYLAWEVKDPQASMVSLKAKLYENDKIIDTIETNAYGMGKFIVIPKKSTKYTVKLMHSAFTDSTYQVPEPIDGGLALFIKNAVVKDTVRIVLRSKLPQKVSINLKDTRESYLSTNVNVNISGRVLKIPLTEVPAGLKTITILDSLGRPLAERMIFAHYAPEKKISISTDQQSYGQRQKVTLKLKLGDADTIGLVSIACVQDNRMSAKLNTDIESYLYLNSELSTLPLDMNGRGFEDSRYLEDMLMVKGWRKYTWQNEASATNPVKDYDPLDFKIALKRSGKPLKKVANVSFLKDNGLAILETDQTGVLIPDKEALMIEYGKKIHVLPDGGADAGYEVETNDPYIALNKNYTHLFHVDHAGVPSAVQDNNELSIKGNEKVIRLMEVKITSGHQEEYMFSSKRGANKCGDYVCRYNILNCPNHYGHFENTQPIAGRRYKSGISNSSIIYKDCEIENKSYITSINGIYTKKEFYMNDYADPVEPATVSTIYWNHAKVLNKKQEEMTFYTSDLIGRFRIIVQGITDKDVLYGQQSFEVKAK